MILYLSFLLFSLALAKGPMACPSQPGIDQPKLKTFYDDNRPKRDTTIKDWALEQGQAESYCIEKTILNKAFEQLKNLKEWQSQGTRKRKRAFVKSLLVARNNVGVFEAYANGGNQNQSQNVHSASKSLLSLAIGKAIDLKCIPSVDTNLKDLLAPTPVPKNKQNITLKQLLSMQSGLVWDEDESEETIQKNPNRLAALLALPVSTKKSFNYSTANTHLQSIILNQALKKNCPQLATDTCDFVHKYILSPMNVEAERWLRDPQGQHAGGYGVYLTARELSRIGSLYANGGKDPVSQKQLIPLNWVSESTQQQANDAPFAYGYNIWKRKFGAHEANIVWGYGGQFSFIIKDLDLVVTMTTDTQGDFNEDARAKQVFAILEKQILPAVKKPCAYPSSNANEAGESPTHQ